MSDTDKKWEDGWEKHLAWAPMVLSLSGLGWLYLIAERNPNTGLCMQAVSCACTGSISFY